MAISPQPQRTPKMSQREIHSIAHEIEMTTHHSFSPTQIKVNAGDMVRWTNKCKETHTVTLDPKLVKNPKNCSLPKGADTFDSGPIHSGEHFECRFEVPGRYRYFCKVHESKGMTGEIIVKD